MELPRSGAVKMVGPISTGSLAKHVLGAHGFSLLAALPAGDILKAIFLAKLAYGFWINRNSNKIRTSFHQCWDVLLHLFKADLHHIGLLQGPPCVCLVKPLVETRLNGIVAELQDGVPFIISLVCDIFEI